MTNRGRSDSLVVESDRKKMITFKCTCRHLRDLQGYCVHTSGVFLFFFFFSRQCVAPIAHMDEPPLETVCVLWAHMMLVFSTSLSKINETVYTVHHLTFATKSMSEMEPS